MRKQHSGGSIADEGCCWLSKSEAWALTSLASSSACTPAAAATHAASAATDSTMDQRSSWSLAQLEVAGHPLQLLSAAPPCLQLRRVTTYKTPCATSADCIVCRLHRLLAAPTGGAALQGGRPGPAHLLALQHVVVQGDLVDGDVGGHRALDPLEVLVHRVVGLLVQPVVRPALETSLGFRPTSGHLKAPDSPPGAAPCTASGAACSW